MLQSKLNRAPFKVKKICADIGTSEMSSQHQLHTIILFYICLRIFTKYIYITIIEIVIIFSSTLISTYKNLCLTYKEVKIIESCCNWFCCKIILEKMWIKIDVKIQWKVAAFTRSRIHRYHMSWITQYICTYIYVHSLYNVAFFL